MAKVLYLIASHTNPDQVVRLVRAIKSRSPESQILIHHDYSNSHLDLTAFESMSNVTIMEDYVPVLWGDFSMIKMELHCINWLMTHSVEFDWLIFLSGQDYPIHPISQIEQFLEETEYDGFMEYFLAEDPPEKPTEFGLRWLKHTGKDRFFYRYYKLPSPAIVKSVVFRLSRLTHGWQSLVRFVTDRNGAHLGIRAFSSAFTPKFRCYAGSQWHTLSYRCIQYIHDFVQCNPSFVEYYQRTIIPDESFFQTIVLNQPTLKICNDNKRFIAWTPQSTPAILGVQDCDRLIHSNQHFARKFDIKVDAQVLDRLDRHLSGNREPIDLAISNIDTLQ
ncbi:hypothetical protein NDI39_10495 [Microcoleus sp. ZQ-A2]|nr:N-acetylglucosaminyltransferase [Microcoleus sp. FACHB-1]